MLLKIRTYPGPTGAFLWRHFFFVTNRIVCVTILRSSLTGATKYSTLLDGFLKSACGFRMRSLALESLLASVFFHRLTKRLAEALDKLSRGASGESGASRSSSTSQDPTTKVTLISFSTLARLQVATNNPLIGRCRSEQSSDWAMPERTILWLGDAGANRLVGLVRIRRNWKTCAVICQTYLRGASSKNESDFSHSLHFQRNLASTEWRKLGRKPDARWKPLGRAGENEVPAPGSSEGAWKVENRRRFLWKASLKHLRNKFKQHWKLTVLD